MQTMNVYLGMHCASVVATRAGTPTHCHRIIIVSNQLPIKAKRSADGSWDFEWDKWGLMKQAGVRVFLTMQCVAHQRDNHQDGISSGTMKVLYVGCLPADVPPDEEEVPVDALVFYLLRCAVGSTWPRAHNLHHSASPRCCRAISTHFPSLSPQSCEKSPIGVCQTTVD